MQAKSIVECSRGGGGGAFCCIKLPLVIKIFVLSIFQWPLKTDFTVNKTIDS